MLSRIPGRAGLATNVHAGNSSTVHNEPCAAHDDGVTPSNPLCSACSMVPCFRVFFCLEAIATKQKTKIPYDSLSCFPESRVRAHSRACVCPSLRCLQQVPTDQRRNKERPCNRPCPSTCRRLQSCPFKAFISVSTFSQFRCRFCRHLSLHPSNRSQH